MKKLLTIFLIFSVLLSFTACFRRRTDAVDADADAPMVFLCAGLDEAAENTDVLFLLSLDPSAERISVMQIPRDTYFRADTAVDKINGVYAASRCRGESAERALSLLSSLVSETFSVSLSGSVAFTAAALRAAVDAMGGVAVTLPSEHPAGCGFINSFRRLKHPVSRSGFTIFLTTPIWKISTPERANPKPLFSLLCSGAGGS